MSKKGGRVFVALSGGVDSAVSAALLKEAGYDVTGVFIKIWSPEFLECTWREDRLEAMRVAVHLDIPFKEIDLSEEYKNSVVTDMLSQYKAGRTPNPDVLCNETIKFGAFAEWAFESGAERIATGHYARIESRGGNAQLLKGKDPGKDQSYFLYRLPQEMLSKTIFPAGCFTKTQIREKANEFGLPNRSRPDSQGLCFVGDVPMSEFLARFITLEKGSLIDAKGDVLGEHDGAALYTIGQRHGFHLYPEAGAGPYYVTAIDARKNIVQVSKTRRNAEHTRALLSDMHWIGQSRSELEVVPRYHAKPASANIAGDTISFIEPTLLTPGQSLVFYEHDICLGGAVMHSVLE